MKKETIIVGYVTAAEWDGDEVSVVDVITDDGDYVVEANEFTEELIDLAGEEVEVTGYVREDEEGTRYILVTDYELLEEDRDFEADAWYDEELDERQWH